MWLFSRLLLLLVTSVYAGNANGAFHTPAPDGGADGTVLPLTNRNGWVNPEDLAPMPQCIAQQDQSAWLGAMTRCTSKRCTSHFGIICTHHQWLTQLSCLSTEFSPDLLRGYLPYCARSVLAKAQLYQWVRSITGRTWLVDVGDANELQHLSPGMLVEGYTTVDVVDKAPQCLTDSTSALTTERFQRVLASCTFTSTTQHTGNVARPWEYRESLRSMIALDTETVGHDLVGGRINDGNYFDKNCFCRAFTIDFGREPCAASGQLEVTKERLWIDAICGPRSLPGNWKDGLKTTKHAYIAVDDWDWPICFEDMPKEVFDRPDQCATDACEIDSNGFCKVKRSVERACFCRDVSYDSSGGSCHVFETRIDYVEWLHRLCGGVQDWHGLPDDWYRLAVPTVTEMIPWRWTIKSSNDSDTCVSNEWKLGSFAIVNMITLFAAIDSRSMRAYWFTRGSRAYAPPQHWFFKGAAMAAIQLLANWFSAFIVRTTSGYEHIASLSLMLLWCSMPRPAWLNVLIIGPKAFEDVQSSIALALISAETILQCIGSFYMLITVEYGFEHSFYFGALDGADREAAAMTMYAGALLWLAVLGATLVQTTNAFLKVNGLSRHGEPWSSQQQRSNVPASATSYTETATLIRSNGEIFPVYGTISVHTQGGNERTFRNAVTELYTTTVGGMILLWIAQWLFWSGFIALSSDEFCPPNIGIITVVWIIAACASAFVTTTPPPPNPAPA
ncbi:hypothetical protein BJY04DRAFT_196997 [Aspergillus karnatakaensis]|uniref:uncharacterized protein n=1 Tax=Aspergillus karnatakaensis TaxID=1810916 RepID=UPI003CCD9DAF